MIDWTAQYDELEIIGKNRKKRVPTELSLKAFEDEAGLTLPTSFRAFALLFGAGELCGYYRFHVPLGRKDAYDLATFNGATHGPPDNDTWTAYASADVLSHMLFFASTVGGELFAWRTDQISNRQHSEYAIYRFPETPPLRKVSKSFGDFFEQCRKGELDAFDEPPKQSYLKY